MPAYLLCVQYFRNYRQRALERRFSHLFDKDGNIKPDADLNPLDAQQIVWSIGWYEYPFSYNKSLEFALFKTYGIPAVSKLLCETDQLVGKCAAKRGEDTVVLFQEFIGQSLNSARGKLAVARMNWLHARYRNKILDNTLLFTFSAILVEVSEWMKKFEWRPMTPLEEFAHYVFWREIASRMSIPESIIPSSYAEVRTWYRQYEAEYMVYTDDNHAAGEGTVNLMLGSIRIKSVRPIVRRFIIACMEEHLRIAMGFEKVSPVYLKLVLGICAVRRFVMKHLTLPRYYRSPPGVTQKPNSLGRLNRTTYNFEPYYVPTKPKHYFLGLFTGLMPSKTKYLADGFIVEEDIGPDYFKGKGLEEIRQQANSFPSADKGARLGCPFSFIDKPV